MVELDSVALVGLQTPEWVPFAAAQYPQEQSPDDERALAFDSEPLAGPLDLLGAPVVRLRIAASAAVAKVAARLTEVTPDGRSWLASYGGLNLTHRDGHAAPEPLTPGQFYDVELPLYLTGRRLREGSRIRLVLSESLWPLLWPSPTAVKLQVDLGASSLRLPVRPTAVAEPGFPIPIAAPSPGGVRGDAEVERRLTPDGWAEFDERWPPSQGQIAATGTVVERSGANVRGATPARRSELRSLARLAELVRYRRGDWDCQVECECELTSTAATEFHVRERTTRRG